MDNEYIEMFAGWGGELLTMDADTNTATIAFDDKDKLDVVMEMIHDNSVANLFAKYATALVDGQYILTITSTL